jgi:hypothetical protein
MRKALPVQAGRAFFACFYYVTNNPDFTELQRAEMFSIWVLQSVAE